MEKKHFYFLLTSIFLLALFLRFYQLEIRPLHFDEGNDAIYFIKNITQGETVNFNHEKHGLLTYYLTSLPLFFLPISQFTLRLIPALFGSLLVLTPVLLKTKIGERAALITSLLLAISPCWVYYSRFLINYPFFAFFLLVFLGLLMQYQTCKSPWLRLSLALSFTSLLLINEAWIIQIFIFLLFLAFFRKDILKKNKRLVRGSFWKPWIAPISVSMGYFLLIQTNFFKNWENLSRWISSAGKIFSKTESSVHQKSSFYYFQVFFQAEWPLVILIVTTLILIITRRHSLRKILSAQSTLTLYFLSFWTGSSWLFFSIIPYKTPWVLSLLIIPTILLFSFLLVTLEKISSFPKKTWRSFLFFLLGWYFFLSIYYNFIAFAAPQKTNPLSYGQVGNEIYETLKIIKKRSPPDQPPQKILLALEHFSPLHFYLDNHLVKVLKQKQVLSEQIAAHFDLIIMEKDRNHALDLTDYSLLHQQKIHNLGNLIILEN